MASPNYKARKEAFVSNLNGGSVWEINEVTLVAPSAMLLWSVLQSRQKLFTPYTPAAYLVDFLLNCGALMLACTLYSSAPALLNLLLIIPSILVYFTSTSHERRTKTPAQKIPKSDEASRESTSEFLPAKPFITAYRGGMLIITCVAILAVDFRVFPRRFAKVENWGTSLMDMGVGSFVFTMGIVSARPVLKERFQNSPTLLSKRLIGAMRHSAPILLLGFVRLYTVKGLDYAEHVTEYGVHWNFFFTLGFLPPFIALFQSALNYVPSYAALALLLACTYEAALDFTDLKAFIIAAPRTNLLSKNREGIFSFFGYLAIFLAGQACGMDILTRPISAKKGSSRFSRLRKSILGKLIIWTAIWTILFNLTTNYYGLNLLVSRRLANLPYFLWVSAFNCGQLALFCAIESFLFPDLHKTANKIVEADRVKDATSRLLHAFNRNGLAIFLLANLLTGLVNLTLPTLEMDHIQAMAVLVAYMGTVSMVAVILDAYNVSIKF
ncbi:GPI-anchored wall transfer protein 1 [Patellaria atrata CBS 101060]|uniref:GPI-anchored wall transfer protein n=1 Tax=Patellaria atrata CBS 101060 TaxID=1346257 RepID=A0A9P4SAW2_9PEZI|nr:GPI-anchored wall transfer protein 1 [Patellaria atrata CBS 101060]